MNCPHCQKELPENHGAVYCLFCGRDLVPEETGILPPIFESNRFHWPKFCMVLFTPAVGCFLSLAMDVSGLALIFGLVGSVASGLICARMIMGSLHLAGSKRFLVHFVLAMLLCGLAWLLCFLGCAGGATITNRGL
jgi:hypothetical protein